MIMSKINRAEMNSKAFSSVLKYLPNLVATILLILVVIYFVPRVAGNTTMYSSSGLYMWAFIIGMWLFGLYLLIRFFCIYHRRSAGWKIVNFVVTAFLLAYGIPSSFNLFHNQLFLQQYLKFAPVLNSYTGSMNPDVFAGQKICGHHLEKGSITDSVLYVPNWRSDHPSRQIILLCPIQRRWSSFVYKTEVYNLKRGDF